MQNLEFNRNAIRAVEVYRETWEIVKSEFWVIFGIVVIGLILGSVIPIVAAGPMVCGVYLCLLDKVDGGRASFDKLFKGLDYFLPSVIVMLVVTVPVIVFIFLVYVPMIGMAIVGQRMNQSELLAFMVGTFVFELAVGIVMMVIHSLILFALPLIVDRQLGAIAAMKLSARAVWANKGGIAGLFGVGFLVILVGYLLLCVGVYLALPVIFMANTVAYRKVFPRPDAQKFVPPPPQAYGSFGNAA